MTQLRQRMSEDMRLSDFRQRTQEHYLGAATQFVKWLGRSPETVTDDDVRNYFLYLREDKQLAPSTIPSAPAGLPAPSAPAQLRSWAISGPERSPCRPGAVDQGARIDPRPAGGETHPCGGRAAAAGLGGGLSAGPVESAAPPGCHVGRPAFGRRTRSRAVGRRRTLRRCAPRRPASASHSRLRLGRCCSSPPAGG